MKTKFRLLILVVILALAAMTVYGATFQPAASMFDGQQDKSERLATDRVPNEKT